MDDCTKAAALADFLLWSQTDPVALRNADRQGFVLPTAADEINRAFMLQLKAFTCAGRPVSALANCITDNGQLCSGQGTCTNNACVCESGWEGQYCERVTSSSDSTVIVLGTHTHTHDTVAYRPTPKMGGIPSGDGGGV